MRDDRHLIRSGKGEKTYGVYLWDEPRYINNCCTGLCSTLENINNIMNLSPLLSIIHHSLKSVEVTMTISYLLVITIKKQ